MPTTAPAYDPKRVALLPEETKLCQRVCMEVICHPLATDFFTLLPLKPDYFNGTRGHILILYFNAVIIPLIGV